MTGRVGTKIPSQTSFKGWQWRQGDFVGAPCMPEAFGR